MTTATAALTYETCIAQLGISSREGQRQLVERGVLLDAGQRLLVKAPTATGKSLAALITAGIRAYAARQDRDAEPGTGRTVIATFTRLLQDQYADKDFEAAQGLFPNATFAVLKGATNYLCRRNAGKGQGHEYIAFARETGDPGELRRRGHLHRAAASPKCKAEKHTTDECGFMAARANALAADIVITNHTLVLFDARMSNPEEGVDGLLGPHDLLIVDEIHNLPRAAEAFGSDEIDLDELRDDYRKEGEFELADVVDAASRCLRQGDPFSDRLPDIPELEALSRVPRLGEIERLWNWLQNAVTYRRESRNAPAIPQIARHYKRWADSRRVVKSTVVDIAPIAAMGLSTKRSARAVLMMSATTGTPAMPTYVAQRCGVPQVELLSVTSALDYPTQMRASIITAPRDWELGRAVRMLCDETDGRTLVLCRSWKKVHEVSEYLRHNGSHIVYSQDQERPTNNGRMVTAFKEDVRSVLVGTASFYEGIDVPGDSLSQVVIVDLPELMTMDPVSKERRRRAGAAWTNSHQVPSTALLLEQQMGRLIRSTDDRGLVAVIDPQAQFGWRLIATRQALAAFGVPELPRRAATAWFKETAQ